jgi:hypothetical protein
MDWGHIKESIELSFFGAFSFILVGDEDRFYVWDEVLYYCFALGVEKVQNYYDCQLNLIGCTFKRKPMTERVSTKEEVPDDPLCWYSSELQVTPQ